MFKKSFGDLKNISNTIGPKRKIIVAKKLFMTGW
jgi:hypothetical protein